MVPLRGVVVGTSAELTIRLSTRARIQVPHQKGLRLGDVCYVLYNYTIMKARHVWTEAEYREGDIEPQIDWDETEEPDHVDAHVAAAHSDVIPGVSL